MRLRCIKKHRFFEEGVRYEFHDDGIDESDGVHYYGAHTPEVPGGYFYFNIDDRESSECYLYDYFQQFKYGK